MCDEIEKIDGTVKELTAQQRREQDSITEMKVTLRYIRKKIDRGEP